LGEQREPEPASDEKWKIGRLLLDCPRVLFVRRTPSNRPRIPSFAKLWILKNFFVTVWSLSIGESMDFGIQDVKIGDWLVQVQNEKVFLVVKVEYDNDTTTPLHMTIQKNITNVHNRSQKEIVVTMVRPFQRVGSEYEYLRTDGVNAWRRARPDEVDHTVSDNPIRWKDIGTAYGDSTQRAVEAVLYRGRTTADAAYLRHLARRIDDIEAYLRS